ncbi:MAG TPA: presqualene diphosphate synthase HpnD [Blastocatellia bacterium]|nr:presqualene diphosphate synthase HpnD [Blastocatellia bacterium]HMX29017.1 presqualene diphosphate synthase HpnD [Blastocatellia bacterium]HMY75693.1 presqualene diphosphate synthase HpnD [Blastocatellia bacterium]HMZ20911.1 presqualene diphosphate synthase HpnD [Blastocatellia bacterium]HNG31978.1 presqualene diphosphate synthase HpnD [Blastocatellia bacterium]
MEAATSKTIHLTPWHLRERTRNFKRDFSKTIQSNFFYSFLFLPRQKRDAIIDVYRFCRAVDDVVDDIAEDLPLPQARKLAQAELEKWREEIDRLYAGNPTLPISHKLQNVLAHFPMPKEYFLEMIHGCEMDLQRNRYGTFDELYQYCYRVAAVTGLMCIEIFTYRLPETRDYAVNLGIALQLTNILRDIKEDAERGRIYLPQEDLLRFDYSESELRRGIVNDNFRALMKFECDRARHYYQLAADGLPREDRPTLTAAQTMGKIYFRLLEQIERVGYDIFTHQVRLHRPERFLIALSEWMKTTGGPADEETGGSGDGETGGSGDKERVR